MFLFHRNEKQQWQCFLGKPILVQEHLWILSEVCLSDDREITLTKHAHSEFFSWKKGSNSNYFWYQSSAGILSKEDKLSMPSLNPRENATLPSKRSVDGHVWRQTLRWKKLEWSACMQFAEGWWTWDGPTPFWHFEALRPLELEKSRTSSLLHLSYPSSVKKFNKKSRFPSFSTLCIFL